MTWTVRTEVFDGPLDLLLYLVERDGIDLRAFPVLQVADAYLAYLDRMRELHLGIAGEYLVMAARLCHLKSLALLPRRPTAVEEDADPDPAQTLAEQLLEYERYRRAALDLGERVVVGREVFVRAPQEVPSARRPVSSPIDAFGLLDRFYELITRRAAPEPTLDLGDGGPDVIACCRRVLSRLAGGRAELGALLAALESPAERVVSFVAVLEMARLGWVELEQAVHLGPIIVDARVSDDIDISALSDAMLTEAAG